MSVVLQFLIYLITKVNKLMSAIDDLTAAVKAQTTVDASAVTLIQGIAAQLAALPNNDAALKDLTAQLNAAVQPLSAAVVANTPAAGSPGNT